MKVVVVFESMSDTTEAMAAEVARGVAETGAQVVVTRGGRRRAGPR